MKQKKVINAHGTMSNLVGMYAINWDNAGDIKNTYYVQGKADDGIFILQQHNVIDGSFYKACLLKTDDLTTDNWTFYSTKEDIELARNTWGNNLINKLNK